MPTQPLALTDEAILRFFRFSVVETAAATFTEQGLDTQLSIERGVIWLIHFIEFEVLGATLDDPGAASSEEFQVQLTRETKPTIVGYDDADLIEKYQLQIDRATAIGTDAGPLYKVTESPKMIRYVPAIPFAASTLFVGVAGTSGSAGTYRGRVGYTIRTVSDKFFFRVASALIG